MGQVVGLSNDLAGARTDYARLKDMYDNLQVGGGGSA